MPLHDIRAHWRFEAIGTRWDVETAEPLPLGARRRVTAVIDRFDRALSRFRDDSLVTRMAREPGEYELPAEAVGLFDLMDEMSALTAGRFNPLVGRALESLGYDRAYTLRADGSWVEPRPWSTVHRAGARLRLDEPALVDVGACGKGYLVDLVGQTLERQFGIADYVVDAGSDMRRGPQARVLRVGLEDPADLSRVLGVVQWHSTGFAASASNRRAWGEGLHHVLDGTTGRPVHGVVATWATAASCARADALATALFVAAPDDRQAVTQAVDGTWAALTSDGRLHRPADFPGEVFDVRAAA